jgi:hypothetical protein
MSVDWANLARYRPYLGTFACPYRFLAGATGMVTWVTSTERARVPPVGRHVQVTNH